MSVNGWMVPSCTTFGFASLITLTNPLKDCAVGGLAIQLAALSVHVGPYLVSVFYL